MRCRHCGVELHKKLEFCPSCGKPLKKLTLKMALILCGVSFSFLAVVIVAAALHEKAPLEPKAPPKMAVESWKEKESPLLAYHAMQPHVMMRLKDPSSAKFPGLMDGKISHVKALAKQNYRIDSWVESKNGFGMTVRTRWVGDICQIDKGKWQLKKLEFEQL